MADFEINLTAKGAKEVNLQIEKMTAGLSKIIKEVSDLGIKLGVASTSTGDFAEAAGTTSEATEDLVESSEKLRTAVSEVAVSVDKASESYQEITKSVEGAKLEFTEISDSADDLTGSLTKVSNSSENAGESLGSIGDNADEVAEGMVLIAEQSIAAFEIISEVAASAIEAFSTFNQAMISTSAIGDFTRDEMGKLTEKVIELGIATSATPLDIADLTTELARAGYAANEQIGALEGIIRASEASGESLSDTGAIIGQVIKTFGLSASESITVADSLVAAANSTSASIVSLGEGFTYVGSQAVLTNQSVNEIVTGLALLSDVGLAGSVGGTALAEALRRLSLASAGTNTEFNNLIRGQEKMSGAFSALGASIRDSNGQLLPLSQILPIIKQQLDKLESQEDKEIIANALFGVQGGRGFLALMEKVGGSFEKVNAAIVNSEGVAKQTGEVMLNSLGGSFKLLNSSIDTLNIEIGAFAGEVLRPLIEAATGVINGFLNLPPVVQKTVFSIGALTTAVVGAVLVMSAYEALQIKATVQAIASAAAKLKETAANFLLGKSLDTVAASALNSSRALLSLDVGFAKAARSGTAASASIAGAGVAAAGSAGALATLGTAIKSFTTLIGAGLTALAPFVAAAAAWGLVVKTWGSIREPAKNAQGAIDELNVALEGYNTSTGQSVQLTEQTKGVFGKLKDAVRGATNDIEIFLFNFKLLPGVSSANESALSGLAIKLGDMQASLNGVASEFNNYRIANKLSTEEAQALIPVLEAAKAATSVLQQEAAKLSDNEDQLVALQAQQQELSGMIDQLKAAAPAQEEFGKKSLDAASAAADAAKKIKEAYAAIGSNLESNLRELDLQITQALTDANNDILLNAEERETAITNIESQGLTDRLKLLEQSLQQRQAISGIDKETQQENAEEIKALEEEIATTKLEIAQESAAAREEAEAEFLERQKERIETEKALRQAAYDEEVRQIEDLKNQAELAAQARIDAQNAVLESLDDQSDAIKNQITLLGLQAERQDILAARRMSQFDNEVESLQTAKELLQRLNDSETSINEKRAIREKLQREGIGLTTTEAEINEAIRQKESDRRDEEFRALLRKQEQEQISLTLSQEQERIDLRRQLAQAEIAKIEAEALVVQTLLTIKAQERLIAFKELELVAKRAEGASQSELISLQGQIEAEKANLELKQAELPLAERSLDIANQQIADIQDAQTELEGIFKAQQSNLKLQQDVAREQARQLDRREDESDRFERAQEGITANDIQRGRALARSTGSTPRKVIPGGQKSVPIAQQMDVSSFKLVDALDTLTQTISSENEAIRGVQLRANGGLVNAGQPYIVGERRPELFVPRVPGTIVPRVPQIMGGMGDLSKIESLLTQLAMRPAPTLNAPATFINQPNPLQTQIELLQGQLRASRGVF